MAMMYFGSVKRNCIKLLIVHVCLLSLLFWGFLLWQNRQCLRYIEDTKISAKAESIEQALKAYLDPIVRSAEVLASQGFISEWLLAGGDRGSLNQYLASHVPLIGCDAIDIASCRTEIVYQTGGTQVQMDPENERDLWYYDFMSSDKVRNTEYFYNSLEGILYIYHNIKLFDPEDRPLGIIGILLRYDQITAILTEYEGNDIESYFMNDRGEIVIHPDQTKIGSVAIYDYYGLLQAGQPEEACAFPTGEPGKGISRYVSYIKELDAYLVVEQDFNKLIKDLHHFYLALPLFILTVLAVDALFYLFLFHRRRR